MCSNCDKVAVCKIVDNLAKFDIDAKKQLGVNITIDRCDNFEGKSNVEDE
jgi:hypothetical protein